MNSKEEYHKDSLILFIGKNGVGKSTIIKSFTESNALGEKIEKTESFKLEEFSVSDNSSLVFINTPGTMKNDFFQCRYYIYYCKIICLVFRGTTNKLFYSSDIDYLNSWLSCFKEIIEHNRQKIIIVKIHSKKMLM